MTSPDLPKMYTELADWWPLLSAPDEYLEEADFYRRTLCEACSRPPHTLLELGSGGGNNAFHLKRHLRLTLVDPAPAMLAISRSLNPECEHVTGDMRSVRLGREFDCVFIHDAICYMTSEADLRRALETAFVHCARGGAALFCPDFVRENFRPSSDHGGGDADDGRGLRFLEWTRDPDPTDSNYEVDYVYLLRDADGQVHVEHERHTEGLFRRQDWLQLIEEAGFKPMVIPFEHSELEPGQHEVYLGVKS